MSDVGEGRSKEASSLGAVSREARCLQYSYSDMLQGSDESGREALESHVALS